MATFQIYDEIFTAEQFTAIPADQYQFAGFEAGQSFVRSWLNNKQFFGQKSSGSTGKPTYSEISKSQIIASAQRTAKALELNEGMKALICINMGYIGGKMMLARGLILDWHMHITPPNSTIPHSLPKDTSFDFCALVPLQVEALLSNNAGKALLNSISKIIIGGAATNAPLIRQLQSVDCAAYATYGMTETVSHIALQRLNGAQKSKFFQLLPGVDHELDARGCLKIKADVTNHEWVQANDIVTFNSPGEFGLIGRADNVINTGGVKVQVESLELAILKTGKMVGRQFAISSTPHASLGEQIVLVLEGMATPDPALLKVLKPLLPSYQAPKSIVTLPELPKTMSGKLDRIQLRKQISALPL